MGESSAVTKSLRFFLIVVIGLTIVFLFISLWQKFKASRQRADSLAINHLQFVEYEGGPVNALAYQPGDDLYLNFDVQALPLNDQHRADAEVDIQPLDADGKA